MPNRYISENICKSYDYNSLTTFERDFFVRLILNADDYGRFDAHPCLLKAKLFPLLKISEKAIIKARSTLAEKGMILLYSVDGKPVLQFTAWLKYQTPRAQKSKYPAPQSAELSVKTPCMQMNSDECKCSRNRIRIEDNAECNSCPLFARARVIDELHAEFYPGEELPWPDVFAVAKQMIPFDMKLIRKAMMLTLTSKVQNFVAYMLKLCDDWNDRGIHTFQEFQNGKNLSNSITFSK